MAAGHQLRLLLWKDYLIRKRKLITLAGITWAIAVMLTLYIVRVNVDNQDFPTCQFPARALPSAGLVTFLQSFICSVNNECSPMSQYQEIPTYENSTLTKLQRKFSPLLYNETVLDVAGTVPDALKLLATLADIVDEPTFIHISKNGLKVQDLFTNPARIKRYIVSSLDISKDAAQGVMLAELNFQGIFKGNIDRCSTKSISNILTMTNSENVDELVRKLCSLSETQIQKMAMKLLMEVNFKKYISMIGNMYQRLSGDDRLTRLADMLTAVLHMLKLDNFVPSELVALFLEEDADFSYFNISIVSKLMDLFEPTFGDTQVYKTLRDFTDAIETGVPYLVRITAKPTSDVIDDLQTKNESYLLNMQKSTDAFQRAIAVFEESNANDSSAGVFSVLSQVTKIILKFMPDKMKHDVLFYSTLLSKLMEGALKVIDINMHIQEMAYNVSLRHPDGVKVLVGLPTHVVGKGFEALADAERTQIMTSKLNFPSQMFCDSNRLANFFIISKSDADNLKKQLCSNAWKNYVSDLIKSFGIFEVRDNINTMASLVIQSTLGKNIDDQLYSIDKIFGVVKNFTTGLSQMTKEEKNSYNWLKLFNVTEDSQFMKVLNKKGHLGKQMLITVHGALAKEVVKQNPILEFKISPTLIDITTVVTAINEQLTQMSPDLITRLKKMYPDIIQTMLLTTLDEKKTYRCLSTPSEDIVCNGTDQSSLFLNFPEGIDQNSFISALCETAIVIEHGLKNDSVIAKAIAKVKKSKHSFESVNWTKLINNVKGLYMKLNKDFPYLFEYKHYGMDTDTQIKVTEMLEESKNFWFSWNNLERSVHLSVKLILRLLDLIDRDIFNVNDEVWIELKQYLTVTTGPFVIMNDVIMEVTALLRNESYVPKLPRKTSIALNEIIPNLPQLIVDSVNVIISDKTDITPIISLMNSKPPWPCADTSISKYIKLSENSKKAVMGLETLMCLETEIQQQWIDYIDENKVNNSSSHIFLKFSTAFDLVIEDIKVLKNTLSDFSDGSKSSSNHKLTFVNAWKYAVDVIKANDQNIVFGKFFTKFDAVLNAVNTSMKNGQSTNSLWEDYIKCSNNSLIHDDCMMIGRSAWKYSLQSLSIILENMAADLMTYFTEVNEPNSNLLQYIGFTRNTGLYILYDKMPEFIGTLVNSFWDYGFMTQIRRASLSEFWDCEGILDALIPLPGTGIDSTTIKKVKPIICPSLLHWISLPRGDNTLLDVFAKPQYFFYTVPVQNLSSNYQSAFTKAVNLTNLLADIAKKNETRITEEDIKINRLKDRLKITVDNILSYRINETNPSYRLFNEVNEKQFYSFVYLTRIVGSISKLSNALDNLKIGDINPDISEDDIKKVKADLSTIQKIFKRRPSDAIALHFDLITDVVWTNNEQYKLTNALDAMCVNLNQNDNSKDILSEDDRTKIQICAKNYKLIYGAVENVLTEDFENTRHSLLNLVSVLQNGNMEEISDIALFLKQRKQLMVSLKRSIKYAYDLSIPIYLKYLQNNLENYNVILSFLAGEDWWHELRMLYSGPQASNFFNNTENIFEIAEDILTKLDRIHIVRLLRDVDVNSSTAFCQSNVTLSDYIPDATGALSELKRSACESDKTELFKEIPPLMFASQGYENELEISKIVNYTALNSVISKTEAKLELIKDGPRSPQRPNWITDEKISQLRTVALQLLSKETLTKVAFGMTSNVVDIGTLFLNSSQCTLCSQLTTWFKQINLQLIKKQEYDTLVCHMHTMTLEEVHHTLKNDFHWDMAFKELISSRNYTKNEMNKSVNELLEQIKLHLLEDLNANNTKLSDCLAKNVSRNEFGNATLFIFVLAQTTRLLRAELPHIHEVEGMTDVPYFKTLASEIAHKLDVKAPLKDYLFKNSNISKELERLIHDDNVIKDVLSADVNLRLVSKKSVEDYMYLAKRDWRDICTTTNCDTVSDVIFNHVNKTFLQNNLLKLQTKEFWRFTFISDILRHIEDVINHMGRLVGLASKVDLNTAFEGKLAAIIDLVMQILTDDMLNGIAYSIKGIRKELQPVLAGTPMEYDLDAVSDGLMVLQQIKTHFIENEELKVEVATLFPDPERVESSLSRLGINNTNFWSIAAPRIHAGYLKFKPMLTTKQEEFHISKFVCEAEWMEKVVIPSNLDVVTAEDVHAAVVEQFCGISDQRAKQIISALLDNLDYKFILQKMTDFLLSKLYSASRLSQEQGAAVLDRLPQMAALLPTVQGSVGDLSDTLANEPLFQNLKDFSSVGNLISSSEFLSNAGMMLCGKPFYANINRIYKTVAQSKDLSGQLDQKQLEVLPTDFCRSLYKDIINMDGGKIVWSFVKPLIMGKILYTPDTPLVNRIIEKANSTFSHMLKLTGLVHSFAQAFSSVDKLSQHRAGVEVMRRIMTSPTFSELKASLIGEQELPDINVDGLFDDFGDLKDVGGLLSKASDLLHCVNLRRFRAMPDEDQLMHHAALLSQVDEFSAGLVFLNMDAQNNLPANIEYKIRMDIDNVPTTTRVKNYMWTPGPQSSFIEDMRYFRGFVQIQDLVDRAIIQLSQNKSRIQKRETRTDDKTKWAVYTQQTPYPCYRKDFFQTSLYESQALLVAFFFSLLYTVASVVRFMVADKESGNTMLMSVMGVDLANHTASWFIVSLIEISITCACIATVLCVGGILPRSSPSMVYALLLLFGFSVLCFCYMLSKLFMSASFAAVSSAIAYLVSFMPIVLILSLEAVMSASYKIVVCLSMSSALCYAFLYVARYEAVGEGAHWAHLWASPAEGDADLSIGAAACMLLLDGLIYLAIGWLIDRFFGPKTLRSNITNCETTGEKAGVSIVNITKVYGEGSRRPKVALDNVSIELHKGQITALLGHNGAGKTTLINILTGALRPTSGHVCVRSCAGAAAAPGACPQRDVLIEQLSAREHVALYAQLKGGRRLDHLTHEVDSIMRVLSLGEVSEEPVRRLSGGTRRRVCVALAFVHAPQLVLLDEPTAGVDPAARRDIWSMIVKLKEDRTILLTTHHLDEAELLSDQIVIMHKGQVHTTGSPVEIKRTLGTGYKMSVIYPNKKTQEEPWSDDEVTIEERTKELLTVVRDVVKNASLVDVNENEVELMLPFFDANGLNNNFLSVCEAVESRRMELGYRSYSLDCSSLEQVFFSICQRADATGPTEHAIEYVVEDTPSKSGSSSSIKPDSAPLVSGDGPLTGSAWQQFLALMHIRYLHYTRNRWLLFLLVILPSLFVTIAMAFSTIRPPADNEISLRLHPGLYDNATEFIVPTPSMYTKQIDPSFGRRVMEELSYGAGARNWTEEDTPMCRCEEARQQCAAGRAGSRARPATLLLPDTRALNEWLVNSQELYIEKRYGGFSSALKNNLTNLIAWYNNKGHHAMPSYLNALNTAVLRTLAGPAANITTYSHPLKISKEQISKNTVYQHVADAGISGLVLVAYSLVSAGAAVYLVSARTRQEKRLQLLCGVSPALYWLTALAWDMLIILINMLITVVVMEAFHFPVFVARNNLPAICVLILLYGYACGCLVHVTEKLFSEASVANMVLFCGNAFLGLAGIAILLILDIISESERTDNVRWVLHKVFMLSPQFALGDGLLEIAKNTIQAQVLLRFGMDTYRDPFSTDLMVYQCVALLLVGSALLLLNLAIEYDAFDGILARFSSETIPEEPSGELEESDVTAERRRVLAAVARADNPLRINTIGNINAGFMDTEGGTLKSSKVAAECEDLAQCVRLGKVHRGLGGGRVALRDLTLGIPPGQCTALLGANGAGKSTLFSLLTGQLRPSAGAVCLRGSRASRAGLAAGAIGYCPQSDAIDPLLTVRETLVLYCRLRGIADQDEVVKRTLDTFELRGYACVRCGALSGGNRRKVCAAVAFMGRATLVLLDEPTSGMDPMSRACVSRGVRQCCARGCAVLLSTHALDDARRLAARVALLRRGRLQALAPLDDCLTRFGGGYVVQCVVSRGGQAACARAWRRVRAAAPAARLLLLHHHTLHFLVPARAHVDKQEVSTQLSDIFRLMSKVQSICDIEDYTINQSSLDQMFLSFSDKPDVILEDIDLEPLPTPIMLRSTGQSEKASEELESVTSL